MTDAGHRVGDCTITKVFELPLDDFSVFRLFPGLAPDTFEHHPDWLDPQLMDARRHARMSVHSWLVQTPQQRFLVDTGVGNHKRRPGLLIFDDLDHPYLARLAGAGATPEQVDHVLLTHVHADHVGWNTTLQGESKEGTWVPTFPRARYVVSAREVAYSRSLAEGDGALRDACIRDAGLGQPVKVPTTGVYQDSVEPIMRAGLLQTFSAPTFEVLPGVRFRSFPGHSIDHRIVELESRGERAVFGGDVMHHPLEVFLPELDSMFCEFPETARTSRRRLLEELAETGALYLSSHFPGSSAGRVTRQGMGFDWTFM